MTASFVAFDAEAQVIVLDVTAVNVSTSEDAGLVGKALGLAHEIGRRALPRRLQVKLDTMRKAMFPHLGDLRIDELTIANGSIVLTRGGDCTPAP